MPVDDDVCVVLDGSIHHIGDTLEGELRVLQVVVLNLDSHGSTDDVGMPVVDEPLHGILVVETRPNVVPS